MFVFPVGPLFRLRVSHHLDHAPFPHPAHQTGRADFPHPAFRRGLLNSDSHTFAHEPLPRRPLKLVQSQLLVQVWVRKSFLSLTLLLELRTQPLAHLIAGMAVRRPWRLPPRARNCCLIPARSQLARSLLEKLVRVVPIQPENFLFSRFRLSTGSVIRNVDGDGSPRTVQFLIQGRRVTA